MPVTCQNLVDRTMELLGEPAGSQRVSLQQILNRLNEGYSTFLRMTGCAQRTRQVAINHLQQHVLLGQDIVRIYRVSYWTDMLPLRAVTKTQLDKDRPLWRVALPGKPHAFYTSSLDRDGWWIGLDHAVDFAQLAGTWEAHPNVGGIANPMIQYDLSMTNPMHQYGKGDIVFATPATGAHEFDGDLTYYTGNHVLQNGNAYNCVTDDTDYAPNPDGWYSTEQYTAGDCVVDNDLFYSAIANSVGVEPNPVPWVEGAYYKQGDCVSNGGSAYVCTATVSGSDIPSDDPTHWTVYTPSTSWTAYVRETYWTLIPESSFMYVSLQDANTNHFPPTSPTWWAVTPVTLTVECAIRPTLNVLGVWDTAVDYLTKDVVQSGDDYYIALADNSALDPATHPLVWQVSYAIPLLRLAAGTPLCDIGPDLPDDTAYAPAAFAAWQLGQFYLADDLLAGARMDAAHTEWLDFQKLQQKFQQSYNPILRPNVLR